MLKVRTRLVIDGPDVSSMTQTCEKVDYKGGFIILTNVQEENGRTIAIPSTMLSCPIVVWCAENE